MGKAIDKTITTLGEFLAADARNLARRRLPEITWLVLLRPVMYRASAGPAHSRFQRYDALPFGAPPKPAKEENEDNRIETTDLGMPLPWHARERLRSVLGAEVESVRIHNDDRSDQIAREQNADAVTVGRSIFFRARTFRPEEPQGLALLGHEATHVLEAMRPGAAWRRATAVGVREEEALALGRERSLLGARRNPKTLAFAPRPAQVAPPSAGVISAPQARPMKADTDRPAFEATNTSPSVEGGFDEMRRTLLRDLKNQLRIDFERGA
jgi:hypothetical protein